MFFFRTAFDTETGFSLNLVGKLMLSVSAIFLIVALDLISTVCVIFFARRRGTFFFDSFSSETGLFDNCFGGDTGGIVLDAVLFFLFLSGVQTNGSP